MVSPAKVGATCRPPLIATNLEGVGEAVEGQRAGEADDVAAVDEPPAEAALLLHQLVEMDLRRVLVEPGRDHVLGFLDGHAVHMVDLLAHGVVVPEVRAAGERRVVLRV